MFGFAVLLLVRMVQAFLVYRDSREDVAYLKDEVGVLAAKVGEWQAELDYRKSDEFIRKEAVNQLNWAFPNEEIVWMPDIEEKRKEEESSTPAKGASASVLTAEPDPYWKQWRSLFFGNKFSFWDCFVCRRAIFSQRARGSWISMAITSSVE